MKYGIEAVAVGFLFDLLLGDPGWLYHPVRMMGHMITGLERILRNIFPQNKTGEHIAGACLVVLMTGIWTVLPAGILLFAYHLHVWIGFFCESFFCYQLLAAKSLKTESMKVYDALEKNDLAAARKAVSMIVGRDTQNLTAEGVTKAAVETIAENTSDGVIAPLFYMMIGGASLGFAYKAVNTMDSMVGYRNDTYRCFGTAAAKLDDAVNFIPARISGVLMVCSAFFIRADVKNALRMFLRDRKKHDSPNSAQTESAVAGALGIQLAGDAWYFGKLHKKDVIGDPLRPVEAKDIVRANRMLYVAAWLALLLFSAVRWM